MNSFDPVGAGIFIIAGFILLPLVVAQRTATKRHYTKVRTQATRPDYRKPHNMPPAASKYTRPDGNRPPATRKK